MPKTTPCRPSSRFDRVDALRGLAMVWMTVFHFCFDLSHFALWPQNFLGDPFWTWQRTAIVSLFLLCAGMGQAIAWDQRQTWGRFRRRWLQVAAAALLVSVGSYLVFPRSYIYFGVLHGKLFKHFAKSSAYQERFNKPPVICISVSTSKTYQRTENQHPVLGVEYLQNELSSTDHYFAKMGLQVRFFMPPNSVAPLAFYYCGDLLSDYSNLELIGTISTMETFQKIYRPEIYNANSSAGKLYRPSLKNQDYSVTQIVYDREERSQLAVKQGKFAEEQFVKPYQATLAQWSAQYAR